MIASKQQITLDLETYNIRILFGVHHATTKGAPGSAPALPHCYCVVTNLGQVGSLAVWQSGSDEDTDTVQWLKLG